ncbi:Ger(x)C family spore germination protein [Bacillus fonticola]|uniref:Ger(x)C family spore germination protein n=1 Tax=Bacillus fonticola TaxID=2728853 RepID=UPI0014750E19|nr:Ger(x)C family spore germination protein [Bacillus fonticola]
MRSWSKLLRVLLCITTLLSLTACWDQNLLKDVSLVLSIGFDKGEEKELSTSISTRQFEGNIAAGSTDNAVRIIQIESHTPRESRSLLDRRVSEKLDSSKLRVILLGEELAKQDIFPLLDIFYRDPRSALNARIAVVRGKSEDLMRSVADTQGTVSEYVSDLLESAEQSTTVFRENIQTLSSKLLDPGQDFSLPLLQTTSGEVSAEVIGVSLFDGRSLTGELLGDDATLYILLNDRLERTARLTKPIGTEKEVTDYITFEVQEVDRAIHVTANEPDEVYVNMDVNLEIKIIEYPPNELASQEKIDQLNQWLAKLLTKEATSVVRKLQRARCDGFGIGRRMMAFNKDVWEDLDWKDTYTKMPFSVDVHVDIVQKGVLN